MGGNTKIQWADHTFNPWRGCTKVAAGCANCYADAQAKRNPGTLGIWGQNGTRVVASEAMWREPLKWDRNSYLYRNIGEQPARVFCASMCDVFEDWNGAMLYSPIYDNEGDKLNPVVWYGPRKVDGQIIDDLREAGHRVATMDDARSKLFRLIDATPNLDWLLLTKRPENIRRMWPQIGFPNAGVPGTLGRYLRLENCWLGTSVACQEDADRNIPALLNCRDLAAKLFVSIEPLIEPVDLTQWIGYNPLHENKTSGRSGLFGGHQAIDGNTRGRQRVEDSVPPQESLGWSGDNLSSDTIESRCISGGRVSHSKDNDGRSADIVPCAPPSVDAPSRTDTTQHASESQERDQARQQPSQSGTDDSRRQHETRICDRTEVSEWREESSRETKRSSSGGDSHVVCESNRDASLAGAEVRSQPSGNLKDSSRGTPSETARSNGRLFSQPHEDKEVAELSRAISIVIVGGESGPNARPCNVAWIRSIVRQCRDAAVPCFVKQLGANIIDRNDAGFDADWHDGKGWPSCVEDVEEHINGYLTEYQGAPVRVRTPDRKGGDMNEWPVDLRVRETPK